MITRREYFKIGASTLLAISPFLLLSRKVLAAMTESQIISQLEAADSKKKCQLVNKGELDHAIAEVNPTNQRGILSHAVGCKAPHKHVVFVSEKYIENPELIEIESDATSPDGQKAKIFLTSHAFDMGVVVNTLVSRHQHQILLTKNDLFQIRTNPEGIKKIAYQEKLTNKLVIFGHGFEPGHVFEFKLS